VEATIEVNDQQRQRMFRKIEAMIGDLKGKEVALLGLSFKPQTDDVRYSVGIDLIHMMQKRGASVRTFDPVAMEAAAPQLKNVVFAKDSYEAARGAELLVIATEWNEFRARLGEAAQADEAAGSGGLPEHLRPGDHGAAGFRYEGVGAGRVPERNPAARAAGGAAAKKAEAPKRGPAKDGVRRGLAGRGAGPPPI
jgi:UDPglucose 6-dehydrogenase